MGLAIGIGNGILFTSQTRQGGGLDGTSFITTWRTTTSNETITIPTTGGNYNYDISTTDGQTFTGVTGSQAITFATAGDYDVSISGAFPRIYINNGVDGGFTPDPKIKKALWKLITLLTSHEDKLAEKDEQSLKEKLKP